MVLNTFHVPVDGWLDRWVRVQFSSVQFGGVSEPSVAYSDRNAMDVLLVGCGGAGRGEEGGFDLLV